MSNKMLIDATHPEETRVVVLRGNRVEEFDFESASRKQLRGNIYLAKVTRVEPSLQAAFVDYGGNRHGFLAFSEIHPDYYQIPVADRQALLEDEKRAHRDEDDNGGEQRRGGGRRGGRNRGRGAGRNRGRDVLKSDVVASPDDSDTPQTSADEVSESIAQAPAEQLHGDHVASDHEARGHETADEAAAMGGDAADAAVETSPQPAADPVAKVENPAEPEPVVETKSDSSDLVEAIAEAEPQELAAHPDDVTQQEDAAQPDENRSDDSDGQAASDDAGDEDSDEADDDEEEEEEVVESVGGDAIEEVMERAPRYRRHYKIQEVIKRRRSCWCRS